MPRTIRTTLVCLKKKNKKNSLIFEFFILKFNNIIHVVFFCLFSKNCFCFYSCSLFFSSSFFLIFFQQIVRVFSCYFLFWIFSKLFLVFVFFSCFFRNCSLFFSWSFLVFFNFFSFSYSSFSFFCCWVIEQKKKKEQFFFYLHSFFSFFLPKILAKFLAESNALSTVFTTPFNAFK